MYTFIYSRTCFEWSPATYDHFSLSDLAIQVYLMANLSNKVTSHLSGQIYVLKNKIVLGQTGNFMKKEELRLV